MNKNKVIISNKKSVFCTFITFLGCMAHLFGVSAQSAPLEELVGGRATDSGVHAIGISLGGRNAADTGTVVVSDRNISDDEENTGTIKGKVTTADGQPAASVTIRVKSLDQLADKSEPGDHHADRSTMTDEDGLFILHNLQPGNYAIEISLTGYTTTTLSVRLEHHKETTISIPLQLSGKQ